MQAKIIAECSKGSILQYFWPLLSYHLSLRSLFCLFLSARFTQVLLYVDKALFNRRLLVWDVCMAEITVYASLFTLNASLFYWTKVSI